MQELKQHRKKSNITVVMLDGQQFYMAKRVVKALSRNMNTFGSKSSQSLRYLVIKSSTTTTYADRNAYRN